MADSADVPCSYTDTDADASTSRPKVDFNPVPTYIRDSLLAAKRQLVDDPPRTGDEHQWSTAFSTPVASVNVSAPYSRCFEDSVLLSNSGIRPEDVNAAAEAPWNCDHCFVKHAVQVIGKDNTDFIRYRPVHANAVQENAETSALSWSPTSAAYIPTCVGPHDQPVDSDSSFQDEVTRFARKYAEHLTLHRPNSRSPSPKGVPLSMVGILYTQHLLSRQLNVLFIAQQAAADYTSNLYQTASRVVPLKRTPHPQASIPDDNGIIYASLAETIRESSHEQEKRFARSKAGITALVASELDLLPPHTSVEQEGPDLQNPENGHRHVHVGQPVGGLIEDKKLRTRDYQEGLKTKEETPASCAFGEWVHERKRLNAEYGCFRNCCIS
ncbi:hypothetical protein TGDOM2_270660 [Toxoplasma gondii GAB2-2007-GAL-DOM2]|uniref:Uncharacterized protein n=8 Tax=Toxoplasma gondii TaxID=5811 RepID=B9PHX7_TOXGV|nr:hypothetical protein TGGT1_270660 [Toxoplasma gondii GT1]ESS36247.1 hypothetical protein TGVEG_270660 [Toxoplasma gondii VEG]KAF4642263.1 hypothetical protein TGRH88_080780 [Toxoplasma gondii]KFG43680.1 hypothetical protein TGDOM2_270660 [Toxoplasma gondii GAB2-2007-GAL-DOM2]KFG52167.1 hypothetical protein TGP89_270660 [Toxoplasma gondii p89]KFG54371.1 hypothetical protein TGFOU_270660 [Toxoplasma gondii FOU]PUA92107.1 hypothetical protein TGBR9_270660 [Toxoplasma gondii TgCATBr9]RQX75276